MDDLLNGKIYGIIIEDKHWVGKRYFRRKTGGRFCLPPVDSVGFLLQHQKIQHAAHPVQGLENVGTGGTALPVGKGMAGPKLRLPGSAPGTV